MPRAVTVTRNNCRDVAQQMVLNARFSASSFNIATEQAGVIKAPFLYRCRFELAAAPRVGWRNCPGLLFQSKRG